MKLVSLLLCLLAAACFLLFDQVLLGCCLLFFAWIADD